MNRDTTFEPAVTNAGTVDVLGMVTATFANHDYTQTAGRTAGFGTLDPTGAGIVALQGGVLESGDVQGNLTNTGGEISPGGSPALGALAVTGAFSQSAAR